MIKVQITTLLPLIFLAGCKDLVPHKFSAETLCFYRSLSSTVLNAADSSESQPEVFISCVSSYSVSDFQETVKNLTFKQQRIDSVKEITLGFCVILRAEELLANIDKSEILFHTNEEKLKFLYFCASIFQEMVRDHSHLDEFSTPVIAALSLASFQRASKFVNRPPDEVRALINEGGRIISEDEWGKFGLLDFASALEL